MAGDIFCVGAQTIDSVTVAKDEAGEDSGGMGGVRWNEQVEVEEFLKQSCMKVSSSD